MCMKKPHVGAFHSFGKGLLEASSCSLLAKERKQLWASIREELSSALEEHTRLQLRLEESVVHTPTFYRSAGLGSY